MEDLLREFDPKLALRRLRGVADETISSLGLSDRGIPHTYDKDELLAFANRLTRRPEVRNTELLFDLLQALGIASCLNGAEDEGEKLFDEGLQRSAESVEGARFLYLLGHYVHFRTGDFVRARTLLKRAFGGSQWRWTQKTKILLLLGRTEWRLDDTDGAERAYQEALESGIQEYRPLARDYIATLRMEQSRFDEAVQLNRQSYRGMKRARSEHGMRQVNLKLGTILLDQKRHEEARQILEATAHDAFRVLDLDHAAGAYQNLAVAYRALGNPLAAQAAHLQTLRFRATTGGLNLLSETYRRLGNSLSDTGQLEPALAAHERAMELAATIDDPDLGLRARTDAMAAIVTHGERLGSLPALVAECRDILTTHAGRLDRDTLVELSILLSRRWATDFPAMVRGRTAGRQPRLATGTGRAALHALTGGTDDGHEFEVMLDRRLQPGLAGRLAPSPEALRAFLLLFTGDSFRLGDYSREFSLAISRAKPHIRELMRRGVVELLGVRKAARYELAFHRV